MEYTLPSYVLDAARLARVILAIGSRDCGKTTLLTHLANELFRQGYSVGIIDSDIGQSDIGPPTTIGFGSVEYELTDLGAVKAQQLYFVGSITPRGHLPSMLLGCRRLLDRALSCDMQKILIDSTGFIDGQSGRILKQQKIQALEPDLLICLQKDRECEHILKAYAYLDKPEILRLKPSERCRSKSHPARRNHRRAVFQRYFARAHDLRLSLSEIGIFNSNLFTGQVLSCGEQNDISRLLADTQSTEPGRDSEPAKTTIYWGEWIGEELFLVTEETLQRSQILSLKRHLPAVRYIHNASKNEFQQLLLGLLDVRGDCCGLGLLKAIDFGTKQATVFTPVDAEQINAVQFSGYQIESTDVYT